MGVKLREIELCAICEAVKMDLKKSAIVGEFLEKIKVFSVYALDDDGVHELFEMLLEKYDGRLFQYGEPIDWPTYCAELSDYIELHKNDFEREVEAYEKADAEYQKKHKALYASGHDLEADMLPRPVKPPAVLRMEAARAAPINASCIIALNPG